jgi:hypothetical protein
VKWQRLTIPLIFILGLYLRAFIILSQGLNSDEAKAIGFILDQSWTSITWDNYPPLFYLIGKFIALTPINPILGLKLFVCMVSSSSLFFFLRFLKRQEIFPFWASLLIAIWPVSIFYSTLVRPLVLIEFFAILNFSYFEDLVQGRRHRRAWLLFYGSLVGLMLSTYASALYFAYLAFLAWRRKLLGELDAFERWTAFLFFLASCCWMLAVRWKNLNWLFLDISMIEKGHASAFLLKNLLASNWLFLGLFAILSIWRQSIESLALVAIVFAINIVGGLAIYEARFLLFFYPILFWQIIHHFQAVSPTWFRHLIYMVATFLAMSSVYSFLHLQRSGLSEIQTLSQQRSIEAIAGPIDQNTMAILFPGKQIASPESILLETCCQGCFVFEFLGPSHLTLPKMKEQFQALHFETISQGKTSFQSLEIFEYLEIKRQCP